MVKECKKSNNADKVKLQEKSQKNHKIPENKGITLIALVITVIVLLILAGVTIAMLTGDNGTLKKATEAVDATNKATVREQVQAEVLGSYDNRANFDMDEFKENAKRVFGLKDEDITKDEKIDGVQFGVNGLDVRVTGQGEVLLEGEEAKYPTKPTVPSEPSLPSEDSEQADEPSESEADKDTSYVGYYADLDGDSSTVEGIIYADLAVGENDGQWNGDDNSKYSYKKVTDGLKSYTVGNKVKSEKFGDKEAEIISVKKDSTGQDRFYVMALEDLDDKYHYWYYNAYGNLDNPEESTEKISFTDSNGKTNTDAMIEAYEKEEYGEKYTKGEYTDLWGMEGLKEKVAEGWFVPSRAEWSAFGDMLYTVLEMPQSEYAKYNLKAYYWSSSQYNTRSAWGADFGNGYMCGGNVRYNYRYVRLSTTF